ncbi:hypothetical protein [uncultured Mitsuokella sp.]|uniref:hypothetical protein n=1 Tax=uncultured Mitsuokella sp. TaxID=453120 RepID=UPI00259A0C10|nr:hypothetical protein [uncultured Mitsuokella sp.]
MSFAKKMARKRAKELKKDGIAAAGRSGRVEKKVRHLTPREIVEDHKTVTEAYDTLTVVLDVAVHRKWGWGKERRARLHKKMAIHLLCLKDRTVKTSDIEHIIKKETGLELDKKHLHAEWWDHEREIQYRCVDDMSAIFMIALMDEFGYKGKALGDVYDIAATIAHELKTGEKTVADLRAELEPRRRKRKEVKA